MHALNRSSLSPIFKQIILGPVESKALAMIPKRWLSMVKMLCSFQSSHAYLYPFQVPYYKNNQDIDKCSEHYYTT